MNLIDEKFAEVGIKLERVHGLTLWEAQPVLVHQEAVDRIRYSIRSLHHDARACGCLHYADLSMRFPDGSEKRPDIAIFCQRPTQSEESVTTLPEAVIEVISKDYEAKDYQVGLPFYLQQGIRDVILFNPYTNEVLHCRPDGTRNSNPSPIDIELVCGCHVTV